MKNDEFLTKIRETCNDYDVSDYVFIMETEDGTSAATWSTSTADRKSSTRRAIKDYKEREHL